MGQLWQILLIFSLIYIIHCKNYNNLLNGIINLFKHMSVHTIWTVTCWNSSINRELLLRLSNEDISTTFKPKKYQIHNTWYKAGILVDLACNQSSNILRQASNERLFNLQNNWILFNRHENPNNSNTLKNALKSFKTHMGRAYALPDSRVYLLTAVNSSHWEIWDGFRFSVFEDIRVSRIGMMTSDRVEIKHSDRTNFHRTVIRASTVILEPNNFQGWDKPTKQFNLDSFALMHYAVSSVLADQLNFTLNLTFANDYGWSYDNGSYSGMMGQLEREEIDFTAAGPLMRDDRMQVGDLTVGTFRARTTAIFRQPPLSSVNNIFTLPFALSIWILLIIMSILFAVTLAFFIWILNELNGRKNRFSTTLDTITIVLGAMCQQGLSLNIHSISIRLATFTLFLSAVFLFTSYAASIVVLLQTTSQTIKDINDLVEKPITFSVQDTYHNYIYFNETKHENIKRIYLEKIKPQGKNAFTNPEIGLERVRNEFHSFLVEISLADNIIAEKWQDYEKCSLSQLEVYKIPLLTLYVTKKSGYKDVFKQKMIQQIESGLMYRTFKNIMPQRQKCDSSNTHIMYFDSISLNEIYPVLLLLGYGITGSILLFLFEYIYTIKVNKQKIIQK